MLEDLCQDLVVPVCVCVCVCVCVHTCMVNIGSYKENPSNQDSTIICYHESQIRLVSENKIRDVPQ